MKRSINDHHIFVSEHQEPCHMSCSIQCSVVLSFSWSILFIHSNQPSVQKSSAQPFVPEAVSDSISELELVASASLASLQPITSAITSDHGDVSSDQVSS